MGFLEEMDYFTFPVPEHFTIHRRLKVKLPEEKITGRMIIVDSTGFRTRIFRLRFLTEEKQ